MSEDFREELTRNLSTIRSQVRRVARDQDEVDELTQECVARLLQKERLWHKRGPWTHWMTVVVRRFSISWARARARQDQKRVEVGSMDSIAQPEEDKYSEDDIQHILEQFRHLTEAQREVLQLKYLQGLSTQEVAERLGITSSAVSQRSSKALQTLRERARGGWAQWLWPAVWLQKGITMIGKNKLASAAVLALTLFGLSQLGLSDEPQLGSIVDSQGLSQLRPATADRWQAACKDGELLIGDWLKTSARGANLLQARLKDGSLCLLGPGSLMEVEAEGRLKLLRGFLELEPAEGSRITVVGPQGVELLLEQPTMLRVDAAGLTPLETAPAWLVAYKKDQPEPLGSLLAKIDGRDVPLSVQDHRVFVDIRDQIARTRIVQTFVNHTDEILEGVFSFPLPEGASVSGFAMWIGGEKVEGDIVEKQRARAIYEQILREERDPGLLEWEGGNVFQASVYPIGHTKRIEISYTQVLPRQGSSYTYRYGLLGELLRERPLQELEIEVSLSSSAALRSVSCPSHPVRLRQQAHTATLSYQAEEVTPQADFQLVIEPEPSPVPIRFIPHKRSDEGYFLLAIDGPERPGTLRGLPDAAPLKLLLLADTSASMDPQKRALQAACIEALLGALSERDRFQLHAFDIGSHAAFDSPRPVNDANIDAALHFLERRASLGWTDLDAAFEAAARAAGPGTQLIYLGDAIPTTGDAEPAGNSQRIRSLLRERKLVAHAIGLGSSYEGQVLRAIGATGSTRQVRDRASAVSATDALHAEILNPSLRNIELQIEGIETAAVYPERLASLPAGKQLFVVGRFLPGSGPAEVRIRLRGELGGQSVEHNLQTSSQAAGQENSFIPRLWARAHLDHLLEQVPSPLIQQRIIGLSEDFQIMTPYTSLLVLESDADRERFAVERRFKMRDGEEFFQAGHDLATLELQREQLRLARGWRVQLQRRYLQHFAQMGRREVALVETTSESSIYLRDTLMRGAREYRGDDGVPSAGDEFFYGDNEASSQLRRNDAQQFAPSTVTPMRLPSSNERIQKEELYFADKRAPASSPAPLRDAEAIYGGLPIDGLESNYGLELRLEAKKLAYGGSSRAGGFAGRYLPQGPQLAGLFPRVGTPRAEASPPRWPEPVRAVLAGLDRRAAWLAAPVRLVCSVQSSYRDKLEREIPQGTGTWLLGPERWLQASEAPRQASSLQWFDGTTRGALQTTYGLGRTRAGEEGDLLGWSGPIPYLFEPMEANFPNMDAELAEPQGDTVRVLLRYPSNADYLLELRIDPARQVVLELRTSQQGELTQTTVFRDFVELAGHWYPQRRETRTRDGSYRQTTRYQLQELQAEAFTARFTALLEPSSTALLLPDVLPERAEAKSRAAKGNASSADLLVLTDLELYVGRWDSAGARFAELAALEQGKAGLRRLRRELLLHGRRQAEALELLQAWAAELAAGKGRDRLFVASELLGQAGGFHAREQHRLLETLEPVFAAANPLLDAQADYGQRLFQVYQQLGWPGKAFALVQQLQAAWPHQHAIQSACIQLLFQRMDIEAAFAHVETAVERGIWTENERVALRQQGANLRLQSRRLEEFLRYSAQHGPTLRFGYDHWENVLAALIMLDRSAEADARIRAWLQLDPADTASQPRLYAAVSHALGHYWNLFYYNQKDPRFHADLEDFVQRQRDNSQAWSQVTRIMRESWFAQSEAGVRLVAHTRGRVERELATMDGQELIQRLGWLTGNIPADAWEALIDRLLERWQGSHDAELLTGLMAWAGAERMVAVRQLELELAREAGETVAGAAVNLLAALHHASWSVEREELAMQVLAESWDADAAEPALMADSWLRRLVDWAIAGRSAHAEQTDPEANERSRRDLASQRELWLREARQAVSERLQGLVQTFAVAALRPFIEAEALYWQAQLDEPVAPIEAGYWRLFGAQPDSTDLAGGQLATRSIESLAHLALLPDRDGATADSLLVLCDERLTAGSELLNWRALKIALLVCLDRADATRATLEAWLAEDDRFLSRNWRTLLAVLHAETGDIEAAVAGFEALRADDELGADDLRLLSTWYLLLERDAEAAEAKIASYGFQPEWELQNRLWQAVQAADGIQARVDDEAPRMLRALLRQASWPGNHCWVLQSFYESTKDFRLLACLSEGVIGHTPQGIYNYLQQVGQILAGVHEEATADQLARAIDEARAQAQTAVDRRALAFLDFLASQAAASQLQGAEVWQRRALASFEAALSEPVGQDELRLVAEFLCNLGRLPIPLDEAQRAAVARLYAAQARGSDDYLPLAELWSRLLWTYDRRIEARAVLKNALDSVRQPPDSMLPASADNALRSLSSYTKQLGEYQEAERIWQDELARPYNEQRRREFVRELYNVHIEAYPGYTTSFGKGAQLYRKTVESLLAALEQRSDENHAGNLVQQLLWLMDKADDHRERTAEKDLEDFAFHRLPPILALYQYRNGQNIVQNVAGTLREVVSARAALRFLIVRSENEPRWLGYANQDYWSYHSYTLGDLRTRVSKLGDLEDRLLAVVLPALKQDLQRRNMRNWNMLYIGNSDFWHDKREDFRSVAQQVVDERGHVLSVLMFAAEYLYNGLHHFNPAIDALKSGRARGLEAVQLRATLLRWLQEQGRWQESLALAEQLVEELPLELAYRQQLVRALSYTGKREAAAAALTAAEAAFREALRWDENEVAGLASVSLECGFLAQAVDLFAEAINLRKRYVVLDDWTLSHYYNQQAETLAKLGRLNEAVDAAAGAILAWSDDRDERQDALERLVAVLLGAADLDAFVAGFEADLVETQSESPVLRRALGEAWFRRKAWRKAVHHWQAALAVQPYDKATRARLLSAYDKLDDQAAAVQCLLQSIASAPLDLASYAELGRRLQASKRADEAERAFTSLAELKPHQSEGHAQLAEHFMAGQRPADAVVQWRQVVRIRSEEPPGYLGLARSLRAAGELEEAREVLRKLLGQEWDERFGDVHGEALKILSGL